MTTTNKPMLIVIPVRQIDDGVRYLAVTAEDARAVRSDRAMLDSVRPVAVLDVDSAGRKEWAVKGTPEARAAIRQYRTVATL